MCCSGCAVLSGDLEYRVARLERENRVLQEQLAQSEQRVQGDQGALGRLQAGTAENSAAIDELRETSRGLNGRLDELDFALQQARRSTDAGGATAGMCAHLETAVRENEKRIGRLEHYLDFEVSRQKTDATAETVPAPATASGKLTDTEMYDAAKQALDRGEYEIAREKFQALLAAHPASDNADNAQFWIGESYYRENWYEKAIMEYQKVIENYPDGNKVPASLLKQGLAFYNLDEKANARLILQEMISRYPDSNEAKIARDKLKTF